VTEQLVFGSVTTGASDDLRKVHEISRGMITLYGMGTELASKQLPAEDYSNVRPHAPHGGRGAAVPDRPCAPAAAKLVADHRTLLEALAFTLLETRCWSARTSSGCGHVQGARGAVQRRRARARADRRRRGADRP